MRFTVAAAMTFALLGASSAFAQGTQPAPDVQGQIAWCAKETGPAQCPATYQAVRASDCLGAGNRSCLVRKATEAATANDCERAYQLVYACQCGSGQEAGRDVVRAAGPAAVCKALKGS